MKSNWVSFVVAGGLVVCLGAAYVVMKKTDHPVALDTVPASAPVAVVTTPVIPAEAPVLEGAPPMPEVTGAAPEAAPPAAVSSPPAVAGTQPGGAFSLVDQAGKAVTEKSWPGKYKLVFFGFTHCPDTCPATLSKLAVVMQNYDAKGDKLVPILITVDPARDTPAVMADYVSKFSPVIVGLTGTEAQVKAAEETYKVYANKHEEAPAAGHEGMDHDYAVDHSGYVYLMSPDDALLEVIGVDETAEAIIGKIKLHLGQ